MSSRETEIFDDLVAEQARPDEILATLDDDVWSSRVMRTDAG